MSVSIVSRGLPWSVEKETSHLSHPSHLVPENVLPLWTGKWGEGRGGGGEMSLNARPSVCGNKHCHVPLLEKPKSISVLFRGVGGGYIKSE